MVSQNKTGCFSQSRLAKPALRFRLRKDGFVYFVKVIVIPKYAEIIINSKTTWELRYGAGNTPGKIQPIKKYLPGIAPFMNYPVDEQTKKIAVLTPDAKK